MCGRFVRHTNVYELTRLVSGLTVPPQLTDADKPRYNLAPSQSAWVAREQAETRERELVPLKWGLVPHWAKDVKLGYKLINARSETAAEKPAFRDAMRYRRCLVAADGWYEWRVTAAGKVPTFIQHTVQGGEIVPFFFAGLWASWRDKAEPDGDWLETFTILTREASPELRAVHDRMPVVLPASAYETWIDRRITDSATAIDVLSGAVLEGFHHHPVSTRVNSPKNDEASLLAVDDAPPG